MVIDRGFELEREPEQKRPVDQQLVIQTTAGAPTPPGKGPSRDIDREKIRRDSDWYVSIRVAKDYQDKQRMRKLRDVQDTPYASKELAQTELKETLSGLKSEEDSKTSGLMSTYIVDNGSEVAVIQSITPLNLSSDGINNVPFSIQKSESSDDFDVVLVLDGESCSVTGVACGYVYESSYMPIKDLDVPSRDIYNTSRNYKKDNPYINRLRDIPDISSMTDDLTNSEYGDIEL